MRRLYHTICMIARPDPKGGFDIRTGIGVWLLNIQLLIFADAKIILS